MEKSNRELFESFKIKDTTWRRWSREFLEPDPDAGLRKGRTRMYNAELAFTVWAGGKMLTEKQMTYEESKDALKELTGFMERKHLLPLQNSRITMAHDSENGKPTDWSLEIARTNSGNYYYALGTSSTAGHFNSPTTPTGHYTTGSYHRETITPKPYETPVICTVSINILEWIEEFSKQSGFKII